MVKKRSLRRQGDVATRSKTVRFASRRRLNDFKSTSDRRRPDVGPTKDDVALTSSRRQLVMWVDQRNSSYSACDEKFIEKVGKMDRPVLDRFSCKILLFDIFNHS